MAPFKLKFRMGGSRSTSQETENDQPSSQQLLLNNVTQTPGNNGSSTTIDSEHNTDSFGSLNNDQRALIQTSDYGNQIGYSNPTIAHNFPEKTRIMPLSPPPSYEDVLEENRLAQFCVDSENNPQIIPTTAYNDPTAINQHLLNEECLQTIHLSESYDCAETASRQESTDGQLYSCSTMTTPSQENLIDCTGGSCDPLFGSQNGADRQSLAESTHSEFNQPLTTCGDGDRPPSNNSDECVWSHELEQQGQQQPQQSPQINYNLSPTQEINEYIDNKSSKEMYKAAAKKWGITCKMSDQCRCMDCQSHYFDCEYEDSEHQKTDGGLGAGTPMFISEVMHGTACTIL